MIEISLETFIKELNNVGANELIKIFLKELCAAKRKSMILIFNNVIYYITDKIQKIGYIEYKAILPNYIIHYNMYKGDNNYRVFTDFMNNNFKLYNYPEFMI